MNRKPIVKNMQTYNALLILGLFGFIKNGLTILEVIVFDDDDDDDDDGGGVLEEK